MSTAAERVHLLRALFSSPVRELVLGIAEERDDDGFDVTETEIRIALADWNGDGKGLADAFELLARAGGAKVIRSLLGDERDVVRRAAEISLQPWAASAGRKFNFGPASSAAADQSVEVTRLLFLGRPIPASLHRVCASMLRHKHGEVRARAFAALPRPATEHAIAGLGAVDGSITVEWVDYAGTERPELLMNGLGEAFRSVPRDAAQRMVRTLASTDPELTANATVAALARDRYADDRIRLALASLGPIALPPLLAAYKHNATVRSYHADVVGRVAGEAALPSLLAGLADDFAEVREAAASAIGQFGTLATHGLITVVTDEQHPGRVEALDALSLVADQHVLPVVAPLVWCENPEIARGAIAVLARVKTTEAFAVIRACCDGRSAPTRRWAATALGDSTDPADAGLLAGIAAGDSVPAVRLSAVEALAKVLATVKASASSTLLFDLVANSDAGIAALLARVASRDSDPSVRRKGIEVLAWVLAWVEYPPGFATLLELASDSDALIGSVASEELVTLGTRALRFFPPRADDESRATPRVAELRAAIESRARGQPEPVPWSQRSASDVRRSGTMGAVVGSAGEGEMTSSPPPHVVERLPLLPNLEPPRLDPDAVRFTVLAPAGVERGRPFELDVVAHVGELSDQRYRRDHIIAVRSGGPYPVVPGSAMTIRVSLPTLSFSDTEVVHWLGQEGTGAFVVDVPNGAALGRHAGSVDVSVGGFPIARVRFIIDVGEARATRGSVTTAFSRIRSAFASYASEDRTRVLGRLQGIQKVLPELDVFLDVLSLRSGEYWRERLEAEIVARDAFFLFWSRAARQSESVEFEWRCALRRRGEAFVDPIPLENPEQAPPPAELSHKHFRDWTLFGDTGLER